MKILKTVLTLALLVVFSTGFAQKVKLKKGVALIDNVEVYKYDDEGRMFSLSTLSGVEFMSTVSTTYEEANPAKKMPNSQNFPATLTRWVYTVKFLKSGKELFTDIAPKEMVKNIYKAQLVDAEGNVDEEKLNIFITKYNNENLKYKLVN